MENNEIVKIDIVALGECILKRIWIVIIAGILGIAVSFSYAKIFITPLYQSKVAMYVNNTSLSAGTSNKISTADIAAAQSLVKTYIVILQSKQTLNAIIEQGNLPYTYEQLKSMISASAVNGTEIFEISVVNSSPQIAESIANTIVNVLPNEISNIVEGSSVKIIDYASTPKSPISPNIKRYMMVGFLLSVFASICIIVLLELFNKKVPNGEYLRQTYDIPILCSVPNMNEKNKK